MPHPYLDDFMKIYEKPQIYDFIVGFSGIDPQKKNEAVSLSYEQQQFIKQLVLDELSDSLSLEQKSLVDNLINEKLNQLVLSYNGGEIS